MNMGLFQHFKQGWKVYVADDASLLKIYDGEKLSYFAAFGVQTDPFGTPTEERVDESEASKHAFSLLASNGPETSDGCTLVLVSLQEGDNVDTETLELIEMHAATYTVDAPVRGRDMTFFHIVRNPADMDDFKILALIAPRKR
jgi:hypothetical protein